MPVINIRPGDVFDRLTVLELTHRTAPSGRSIRAARCGCACGNDVVADLGALHRGFKRSCGCLRKETAAAVGRAKATHGKRNHPLYKTWGNMVHRCHNPEDTHYHLYGARGIEVCPEWREDLAAFIEYAQRLEHYGEPGYSIDRIDNSQGYKPGNLRWATKTQQVANQRGNLDSSSGYKGVSWITARSKWSAQIVVAGEHYHLGFHTDEIEAAMVYDYAARQAWGADALLNFPHAMALN
jgi:hypothetical protein